MEVFGFHDISSNIFSEDDYSFTETYYDTQNILNVLGWIPILGTIIGSIRIGCTTAIYIGDKESHMPYHRKYFGVSMLRGVVELCSMGWVFILPDLIVSSVNYRNVSVTKALFSRKKIPRFHFLKNTF